MAIGTGLLRREASTLEEQEAVEQEEMSASGFQGRF
jgi:hypothetical protein